MQARKLIDLFVFDERAVVQQANLYADTSPKFACQLFIE